MTPVRLEPVTPRSRVKHSTTEPLRSNLDFVYESNEGFDSPDPSLLAEAISTEI